MRKNREQLIKGTCKINHISAIIYLRFHTHLLSRLVPKLKSRKSSIIVLLIRNLFNLFINEYF